MESRGRGDGGGGEARDEVIALASTSGETDGDDVGAPASTPTPLPPPLLPAPPCYTVASTPYTGEPAARGLVSNRGIRRGEVIETAHCLVLREYPSSEGGEREGSENAVAASEKAGVASASARSKATTAMGLEHYVFFDRRGRSSCPPPPPASSSSGRGDGVGGGRNDGGGGVGKAAASLRVLLALGVGSLFNHSRAPNVDWRTGTVESSAFPLVEKQGERAGNWPGGGRGKEGKKGAGGEEEMSPPAPLWPAISFIAARDIEPGEELTISYGKPWWEESESEEDESEHEEKRDDGSGDKKGAKKPHRRRRSTRPTHSHMDDEDAFLGAMTLGGGD